MTHKIKNLLQSSFIKSVIVMVSGAAGAQIVVVSLSPIITRLYGPEAFGIMGTFNSIITIIVPIAALTYPVSIVLPKSNQKAKELVRLSLVTTVIISCISLIILILLEQEITRLFNLKEISGYLFLIPLVIIFGGSMQVAEQWLIRTKQFSINARVTFLQSLIINVSKVGVGLVHPVASVLVLITTLSNGLKAFIMSVFIKKNSNEHKVEDQGKKSKYKLSNLAKEYHDFPLFRAPESFFNKLSQSLPVLMLTAFFGPASAGFYSIGRTVLTMPSRLIGNAVGDVFYPRIAEAANNREDMTSLIKKATIVLSLIGIIPYGIVILFGPFLFSFVFGNEWIIAGEYARWLALWAYTNFINKPSVRSLAVLDSQRFHLLFTIITFIVRTSVLMVGFYLYSSDIIAVALFGIFGSILNLGLITITLKISRKKTL